MTQAVGWVLDQISTWESHLKTLNSCSADCELCFCVLPLKILCEYYIFFHVTYVLLIRWTASVMELYLGWGVPYLMTASDEGACCMLFALPLLSVCLLPNKHCSDRIRRRTIWLITLAFLCRVCHRLPFVSLLKLASIYTCNTWVRLSTPKLIPSSQCTHTHTHTLPVANFIVFSLCLFSNRTSDRCTKICSWFIALHTIIIFFFRFSK